MWQSNHGISLVSDLAKVHDGTCHAKPIAAYLREARALEILTVYHKNASCAKLMLSLPIWSPSYTTPIATMVTESPYVSMT